MLLLRFTLAFVHFFFHMSSTQYESHTTGRGKSEIEDEKIRIRFFGVGWFDEVSCRI